MHRERAINRNFNTHTAMQLDSLKDLYLHELQDAYSAEEQLTRALPKMQARANSEDLQEAFADHLEETREQLERVRTILQRHGKSPEGETCEAMEGLIREGEEMIGQIGNPNVIDAGLITVAQRVEHYEIAAYGTLVAFADSLDLDDDRQLLKETLSEEGEADKKLNKLALGGIFSKGINQEASR